MCYLNGSGIKINLKNHSTVLRIKFGEILKNSGKIIKRFINNHNKAGNFDNQKHTLLKLESKMFTYFMIINLLLGNSFKQNI